MALGLALDENNDLFMEGSQFKRSSAGAYVAQKVKIMLQTVEGEITDDEDYGIPYFEDVFIKAPEVGYIVSLIKSKILAVDGVGSLLKFEYDFDNSTRKLTIAFSVDTDYGEIDIDDFTVGEVT